MDSHWGTPSHRKRKRRRGQDRPAIPARLVLDSRLKTDVGLLSEDLFADLFPALTSRKDSELEGPDATRRYIAITPHIPASFQRQEAPVWTFVAVKRASSTSASKQFSQSTLYFSSSSPSLQSFADTLQTALQGRPSSGSASPIDIRILDAVPISLDTIVVNIDNIAIRNIEKAHRDFERRQTGHRVNQNSQHEDIQHHSSSVSSAEPVLEKHWETALRKGLHGQRLLHQGDFIPLSLPSHPITHASPPPARIELCQLVSQGLLSPNTRIVVTTTTARTSGPVVLKPLSPLPNGIGEESEDTSNEQFFTAGEEKAAAASPAKLPATRGASHRHSVSFDSSATDDSELSEDDGDTIGLSLPTISQPSGTQSAFSSATPRPGIFGNAGVQTPGSVISAWTASTIRGDGGRGRLFEARPLLTRVPDSALHPKPPADEDEEARVYVDTSSLVRIGCFSGDWVKLEPAPEDPIGGLAALNINKDDSPDYRVARVYALPGVSGRKPRYAIDRTGSRRSSQIITSLTKATPRVLLSPLLLANLDSPPNVYLSPLIPHSHGQRSSSAKARQSSAQMPPPAKEVTVVKLTTPIATDKNLVSSLWLGIKHYFESKKRLVRNGDLIGIPIDVELGRATYQGASGEESQEQAEAFSGVAGSSESQSEPKNNKIAWFKISRVVSESRYQDLDHDDDSLWAGSAVVSVGHTRMVEDAKHGREQGKTPDTIQNTWQYYLGVKRLPAMSINEPVSDQLAGVPPVYISALRRRIRELAAAATSPQAAHYGMQPTSVLLHSSQRHVGKTTIAEKACSDLGLHCFVIDANDILAEGSAGGGDAKTEGFLEVRADKALMCGAEHTALLIQHIEWLTSARMSTALKKIFSQFRMLIATANDIEKVPEGVRSLFTHEIPLEAPDEGEREGILKEIVQDQGISVSTDVEFSAIAIKTAALVAGDLVDVVNRAVVAHGKRLEALAAANNEGSTPEDLRVTVRDIQLAGGEGVRSVTKADFDVAVEAARKNFADAIGAPKIPNVQWDDVGGLNNVKDAVMETIQLPLERPELFAKGMKKRSGILLYGPPGTGKTLLAKAIATEFSLNFFSVKGPELLNMYIGESEANVRRVFQRARDARPCVVFFDELDSVAPKRGNQGDSGGVMDRIVSQLLAELDGMSNGEDGGGSGVFVIGATNRPDLLDQALLRPGRFDKMLYLGVSDTHDKQVKILEALTRKFVLSPSLSLTTVAETLPFTYTGADLYALCSDSMLKAITRRATSVDTKVKSINIQRDHQGKPPVSVAYYFDHLADAEDTRVVVEQEDFESAKDELVPSVSAKELEHYVRVREAFEQGADKKKNEQTLVGGPAGRVLEVNDDEFVRKTGELSLEGSGESESTLRGSNGSILAMGKGKNKSKAIQNEFGFGDGTVDGDEGLYDS